MNLRQLQHFILVAEERNFRRASERANLSQPALSHSIKALEEVLGVQLFQRTKHSVSLTAMGDTLLKRARRVLLETQNMEDELGFLKSGAAGHLRIGLVPTYAYSFGGKAIAEWMAGRPGVSVEAVYQTSSNLAAMLEAEEIDLFVCDMRQVRSNAEIEVTPIGVFDGGMFCRSGHPILAREAPRREELIDYGFASVRMPQALRDEMSAAFGADGRNKPFLALECDAISVLRTAVLATDLIWLANRFNVIDDLEQGRLCEVPYDTALRIHWGIARQRDRFLAPAAHALVDILRALPQRAAAQLA